MVLDLHEVLGAGDLLLSDVGQRFEFVDGGLDHIASLTYSKTEPLRQSR